MIIDMHAHLGRSPQFYFPDISVERILRTMDSLCIEKIICSHLSMISGDTGAGFRESIAAHKKSKGRILLYTVFNPNRKDDIRFVKDCLEREGFVGIKIHPSSHQCYGNDTRYEPVWEFASSHNVPLLTHSWDYSETNPLQKYSFPALFGKFISKYRGANFILGHSGGRYNGHIAAAKLAKRYENVYLDLSGDCYSRGLIEYLVREAGSKKVMFGSDLTWIDPRTHVGRILDAGISIQDKKNILRLTAVKLFNLKYGISKEEGDCPR